MVSVPVVMAVSAALVGIVPATAAAIMVFAATAMVSVMTAAVMTAAVMTATVMTATAMVSVMTAAVMTATMMAATMMAATVMTATTVLHKRYEAGRDIGFQDRHGGCLCRPRYKTCGDESACKGRRHG
jgi:hypothetical protein